MEGLFMFLDDTGGHRTFNRILDIKLDLLSHLQSFKTLFLDGGIVHKDVLSGFRFNEPVAFFFTKPLNLSHRHPGSPFKAKRVSQVSDRERSELSPPAI